jgi:ABC-type multidrug transport system fused ATPase/permease subunit
MQILFRIIKIAWQYNVRIVLAYLTFFAAIGVALLIPWILGEAIDAVVINQDGQISAVSSISDINVNLLGIINLSLWGLAAVVLGASLVRGLFDFARTYTSDSLAQMVAYDLRNLMYDKLQHLSFAFHDKEHTGNLYSKATADVEAIRRFVMMGMVRSIEVAARILFISIILALLDWKLAILSLMFLPFLVVRSAIVMVRLRAMWLLAQEIMGELATILQENLSGIHVVKAFASEEYEKKKYAVKAQELQVEFYRNEQTQGTNSAWVTLYFSLALGLIMWFGGRQVIGETLTAGDLAKFVLYMGQLVFPIRMSSFVIATFSRAVSSGKRVFDVLDARSPVEEKPDAKDMGRSEGYVRFENVSFAYDSTSTALKNVELSVQPGKVVALLGAPGSGKSTIVNLIPRFYAATEGKITIDNTDIQDFTLASLRRNVGIVQQDVYLFSATVKDNIAYGIPGASLEDVTEAAKVAQLHDQIMALPFGYDTWVGERGATLSGGQRQRLSIARTILLDPPVLILDDSTSSVDVETERQIHRAMTDVIKGRTTFVIAHRLSSVRQADMILVLKDGEIVEQGNHEELISLDSMYKDIYELQLRPQEEVLLDASLAGDDGGDN